MKSVVYTVASCTRLVRQSWKDAGMAKPCSTNKGYLQRERNGNKLISDVTSTISSNSSSLRHLPLAFTATVQSHISLSFSRRCFDSDGTAMAQTVTGLYQTTAYPGVEQLTAHKVLGTLLAAVCQPVVEWIVGRSWRLAPWQSGLQASGFGSAGAINRTWARSIAWTSPSTVRRLHNGGTVSLFMLRASDTRRHPLSLRAC